MACQATAAAVREYSNWYLRKGYKLLSTFVWRQHSVDDDAMGWKANV